MHCNCLILLISRKLTEYNPHDDGIASCSNKKHDCEHHSPHQLLPPRKIIWPGWEDAARNELSGFSLQIQRKSWIMLIEHYFQQISYLEQKSVSDEKSLQIKNIHLSNTTTKRSQVLMVIPANSDEGFQQRSSKRENNLSLAHDFVLT